MVCEVKGDTVGEESENRTRGSQGNRKSKPRGKDRGAGRSPVWEDGLKQSQKDKEAKLRRVRKR